ncbi:MAG: LysR family transcriptional regulator [Betaproteobacteria bacterium]|nr:LysR family transcriptional regulator [Betaproteobacteria bacterium]MBA3776173.1 LysR family transcriptional regulator [Betaproteobacteria bacterium]
MDLRHIRTFVTVAELGTVSKAALRLYVAQPALSRQIANLEDEFGVKLFDRVGRRLLLTSEGQQLLSNCRGLLNHARALGEQAHLLQRGDVGVLRVAASPHLIEGIFPDLLSRYSERYPNVQVRLIDVVGAESFAMLERGEIHLTQTTVLALAGNEQRFASYPLGPMEMLAACHRRLKLGKDGEVEIARLAPYPLLQATTEFLMRKSFDAACRMAGFTPNYVLECRAPHALLAMAEAGHGVAIIPSALRVDRYVLRRVRVMYRGKPIGVPLGMLWDKRRPMPAYAKVFCEMVAEHVQQAFPIKRQSR